MSAPLRTRIEDALVEALSPLLKARGGYLAAIEPYAGEFHGGQLDDIKRALGGRVPALLVQVGDGRYHELDIRRRRGAVELEVSLFAVSGNLRGRGQRTRGAVGDPGIFAMLEDARDILFGDDLDLDGVGPFSPTEERMLVQVPELTAWQAKYAVTADVARPAATERDLTTVRTSTSLPDDEQAVVGDA